MSLTTAVIKSRLAAAASGQKDNEAQNIINGATTADLSGIDAEGVLRLYEALAMLPPRIYSARDDAAMTRLRDNTQFQPVTNTPEYGVNLVKGVGKTNSTLLTTDHVTRIYAAENKRLSFGEGWAWDGSTIGRGQLGQPAYTDVNTHFASALKTCVTRVFIAELLADAVGSMSPYPKSSNFNFGTYEVIVPAQYSSAIKYPAIEDFVVAAYLSLKIAAATKAGRSNTDVLKFAVAVYHGMFAMVSAAQTASGDTVNWSPVETQLRSQGNTDEADYVNEVVK